MNKFTSIGLIFVFICISGGSLFAQTMVSVRVAEFAPNYFKDSEGNWTGAGVELARAIITAAGFEPKFVELPWSRAMKYLQEGKVQYMTNLSKTEERSEFLHWIGPIRSEDRWGLIVHRDNISLPITSLDDLITVSQKQNRNFALQQDISYPDVFASRLNHDLEFRSCFETEADVELNIRKTANKRTLGFIESIPGMQYRIRTDPESSDLSVHPFVLNSENGEIFHGLSKQGAPPEMLKKIHEGYAQCVEDGTLQLLIEKWDFQ